MSPFDFRSFKHGLYLTFALLIFARLIAPFHFRLCYSELYHAVFWPHFIAGNMCIGLYIRPSDHASFCACRRNRLNVLRCHPSIHAFSSFRQLNTNAK